MSFFTLPPEINSLLMYSGAGSAPMLQAGTAWNGLASELSSAAESFMSVTSGLTGQAWQGAAASAMAAAAAPYAGWLSAAASQASAAAAQAEAVASAFESALAATVHPLLVEANRNGLVQLVMSNLFGQNWPAIAATESYYEEMWAQVVSAMVGYHGGAAAAAAQLTTGQAGMPAMPSIPGIPAGNFGGSSSPAAGVAGGSGAGSN
ncbi:MAG: PPE family protein, partial [Mycobacterium sp.]|uniref:PPE family protein n=1 Tax=Mycobacterium sp. TaxID=1785 RepID=UPI003F9D371A